MKPLFQSFYCPGEDKPDHGKVDMSAACKKFMTGEINAEKLIELWKKLNHPIVN